MNDKLRAAAQAALDAMSVVRVFVTTEEKIKHPEGTDWYDNIRINLDDSIVNDIKEMNALEAALAEPAIKESLTAQRPWVGLTDREFQPMIQKAMAYYGYDQSEPSHLTAGAGFRVFAYAIEAKLREKNGG